MRIQVSDTRQKLCGAMRMHLGHVQDPFQAVPHRVKAQVCALVSRPPRMMPATSACSRSPLKGLPACGTQQHDAGLPPGAWS